MIQLVTDVISDKVLIPTMIFSLPLPFLSTIPMVIRYNNAVRMFLYLVYFQTLRPYSELVFVIESQTAKIGSVIQFLEQFSLISGTCFNQNP